MEALNEISMLVKEYISPETLWLVPCLYALGIIIKKSIRIDDTLIPTILCVVGIFLSALISVGTAEPQNWMQWIILGAVSLGQGYVIAAAAICLNQLVKQHVKAGELKKGFDGDKNILFIRCLCEPENRKLALLHLCICVRKAASTFSPSEYLDIC